MRVLNRLSLPGLLVGALAFALIGCGGGGGGSDASDAETLFTVVQEIPTDGQEVAGDLSDVGGVFEIKFSTELDEDTILDPSNPFNGLSSDLNMLDNTLARIAGTPEVKGKYFRFIPPSTGLSPQQYTVTVTRNITSRGGQSLSSDFFTSFTVGPDVYEPIIRRTFPVQNQSNVARDSEIVITFNEALDPGSVNTQTVLVQDGGQNPPVNINGTLSLQNHGFEIHFMPDPSTTMPPNTTVVVTLQGGNGGIADKTNGTPFLASAATQTYTLQFNTTSGGDPVNQFARASCYFSDQKNFGVMDVASYVPGFGPMPGSNGRQVLDNSRRKVGSPGEIILDPRVNGNGDTFAYVVDLNSSTIAVVNTFNSVIVGRIPVNGPRGLATTGNILYVSEYSTDSVVTFNMSFAQPGTNNWNTSGTTAGGGSAIRSTVIQVGRGPYGLAKGPDTSAVFCTNYLDGTCSIISTVTETVATTWQVGASPVDVGISLTFPGLGNFALVTNLGAGVQDPGSGSFWWSANPGVQQWLLTGFQNPRGLTYDFGVDFFVANSGGATVQVVRIAIQGNTIAPVLPYSFHTGAGPQNVALDSVNATFGFTSDMGDGITTVFNKTDPSGNAAGLYPFISVPGVRYVATLINQ